MSEQTIRVSKEIKAMYALDILKILARGPKRYTDLGVVCPNESTRSKRVRELLKMKLISKFILEKKGRDFIHYRLTKNGSKALELLIALGEVLG